MQTKSIRSTPLWRKGAACHDCIFIGTSPDPLETGMQTYTVMLHMYSHFSHLYSRAHTYFLCTVILWFDKVGGGPDKNTGMWVVCPASLASHAQKLAVIHIDTIYHAAHLIPVYGSHLISCNIQPHQSYDTFCTLHVNKFTDHHAFEIAT